MPNPKKRKTPSSTRRGRSHLALKKVNLTKCPKCGEMRLPHTACKACGSYKSKDIVKVKSKAQKTAVKKTVAKKK